MLRKFIISKHYLQELISAERKLFARYCSRRMPREGGGDVVNNNGNGNAKHVL
jgi:hypothetical protein